MYKDVICIVDLKRQGGEGKGREATDAARYRKQTVVDTLIY